MSAAPPFRGQPWDSDFYGNVRTVDMAILNLRKKIEADPKSPRFVQTARGMDYKFAEIYRRALFRGAKSCRPTLGLKQLRKPAAQAPPRKQAGTPPCGALSASERGPWGPPPRAGGGAGGNRGRADFAGLPRLAPGFDGYGVVRISDVHPESWMTPERPR